MHLEDSITALKTTTKGHCLVSTSTKYFSNFTAVIFELGTTEGQSIKLSHTVDNIPTFKKSVWEEQNSLLAVLCSRQRSDSAGNAPQPGDDKLCSVMPWQNCGLRVKDV